MYYLFECKINIGVVYVKNLDELVNGEVLNFEGIESPFFLVGLISAFENRYQAKADNFFEDISWKQFFAIICINLCNENPTIKELADVMGSSHQNVKQILNKLEDKGYVAIAFDKEDKRKQRVCLTEKTREFCETHDEGSKKIVGKLFEGIDEKDIQTVIRTLIQMEKNLEEIE